ncbi:hypothetical protein [Xanthomonas fragariae]|uniref:hypothetical protein n=1 Tax=Xanthomonas fragariae TaxID=48664 RepID=UPI000AB6DC55|nr:hypothetical protein [Xanthomonas fragariae]
MTWPGYWPPAQQVQARPGRQRGVYRQQLPMLATAITCDVLQRIKRWRLDRADAQAR